MELWLPYGRTEIPVRIPDDNFYRIVEPGKPAQIDVAGIVRNALENPLGDFSLKSIAKPGGSAGIILDPILSTDAKGEAISILRSQLSALGVENIKVFQRSRRSNVPQSQEAQQPLDTRQNSFAEIGKTSAGTVIDLDPEVLSCDVKIVVGLALPHFATSFSGGPEAVFPSTTSIRSITKNRALMMKGLQSPFGFTENPVLSDSLEACRIAGPFYNLCFLPDGWGGVSAAIAGDLEPVFREAVSNFAKVHSPRLERKLDIVIVSAGEIFGSDLYHAIRVVTNVLGALRRDGTVILVAECSNGVGDNNFLDYARRFRERKDLFTELRYRFKLGGHANIFLQEILEKCRIQLVSVLPELFVRDTFDLKPSQTASEAVQKAIRIEGKESKILIVPRGEFTVPLMESS